MGTLRFLPVFLSTVILASLGCARDSTPSKPDVPGVKKEAAKKKDQDPAKLPPVSPKEPDSVSPPNDAGDRDAAIRKELKNLRAQRNNRAGGVKRPNTDREAGDQALERSSQILKTKELQGWLEAVRTIGANVDGGAFVVFLATHEPLFKEGSFQQEASARYRLRIKQLPKQSLEHWGEAFRQIDTGSYQKAVQTNNGILIIALVLVEVDRLFAEERFREEESTRCLRRIKSIPQPAIKTWVANDKGSDENSAAIMLMQIDALFDNDQFQSSRLDSALRILKELKENKDK